MQRKLYIPYYTKLYCVINMKDATTIKLSRDTLSKINERKIHPRETYEDVILRVFSGAQVRKNAGKKVLRSVRA